MANKKISCKDIPHNNNISKNKMPSKEIKHDILNFNFMDECLKLVELKTSATVNPDVILYAVQNINRNKGLFLFSEHVPYDIADKIEKGLFEFSLITVSRYPSDSICFVENVYYDKLRDIYCNLDTKNSRINNQTLSISLLNGSIDPYFVAFMSPQQIHPVQWIKELDKVRITEAIGDNKKVTDIYKCRKCGERKSTTSQMQTRSADEPPTIFVTCLVCYNTFRTQ